MRLKFQIMTLLLPAGIIPLIVFALFAFFYIQGNTQRYTINTLQASIEDVSARIEKHMSIANTSLELLANEQSLTSLLRDNPRPDNQQLSTIKRALDNFQRNNPAFISISLLSDNGIILQSTTTSVPPEMYLMNIDDRSFEDSLTLSDFQKQRQEGGLLYMQTRKLKHYPAGQPFDSSEGYLQLIYQINGEEILADAANTTDTGYLALTDSNGNVFFHTAPDGELASELATKAVQGRHRTIKTYQLNGQGYFAGFNRLHQGLYLIGFTSEAAASQQAQTLATYSFWLLLVIILISIGVVHFQSRMMFIDRIISLAELTRRIRDGKPIQDIDISGKDELSDLSKAFQEMAESLKKSQQEINKLAYYDHLTELPNKLTFDAALNKAIEYSERSGRALAILVVDLDNFKLANDVYGHSAGDDILRQVAHRLKTCLGHVNTSEVTRSSQGYYAEDMIIRNGGDEFSILLTDLFQAYQASLIAQRIIDELSLPFKAGDSNVKLGASIGISIYPVDGVSSEQLIKNADLAMFEAKKNGKNNFQFFTQALNSSAAKRLNTEEELNQAIELDEFVLHYQPIIYMPTGRIKVLEALLRWQHPVKGIQTPVQFMSVAEESGQIVPIGDLAIAKACEQLAIWHHAGFSEIVVSINLSPKQLLRGAPVETIKSMLEKYQIRANSLQIEVKENLLTQDQAASIEVLNSLKAIGVGIALDDFGSGFASLSFLKKFPIDTIKIDRSFIRDLEQDERNALILQATTRLARDISLSVVIEGIETDNHIQLIRTCECDYLQGYYFAKPKAAKDLNLNQRWSAQFNKAQQLQISSNS